MRLYRPEDEISAIGSLSHHHHKIYLSMKIEIVQMACDMEVVEAVDRCDDDNDHTAHSKTFFYDVTVLFCLSK